MKLKYIENSLIYKITREEEIQRLNNRIKQIKSRTFDPLTVVDPNHHSPNHSSSCVALPKVNKLKLYQKQRINRENSQLVQRIVHAGEGNRSMMRMIMGSAVGGLSSGRNSVLNRSESERHVPKHFFYRQEEQRRIKIENDRLAKVIKTKRRPKRQL